MAILIKTDREIELMRISGKILAEVLDACSKKAQIGVSTKELDTFAEDLIRKNGAKPAFKGYHGFPATLCTAVNDRIVHGIPRADEILQDGDLLTIDCGVTYEGMVTDAARSIGIGKISDEKSRLIKTANEALSKAIDFVKPGVHVGEIGALIQETIEKEGFHVVYDLTGHGVGRKLHEDPIIANFFDGNKGPTLKAGMTIAIEPIFSAGTSKMKTLKDGWTIVTVDGSTAVQAENTLLITEKGCEVLTELN
ncbi:MAG: type I methionyl aminopeptidase [Candidatus Peregrinibacteria bacterium]|nr:type I methionyl aminopeptidase [Candidatus Peregrinibacteria bacterium]